MNGFVEFNDKNVIGWGNRGWLDIIDFVLEVCKNDSLKTHIMYSCNLNSKQVGKYIQFLLRCKLIEEIHNSNESKRHLYRVTDLGRKYTHLYKKLIDIFN